MDVKIEFLNDYLDDNICIMQPDISIAKDQEHLICKLPKFIYGVMQTFSS